MKIKGQTLVNNNIQVVVLPRANEESLVFKFKPVIDFDEFDNYVKFPEAPVVQKPGDVEFRDLENPKYKAAMMAYGLQKMQWMFLQSISATEDLEWEKVKTNDPATWHLVQEELKEAQLTLIEQNKLTEAFNIANALDEGKLEEARKSFLAGVPVAG